MIRSSDRGVKAVLLSRIQMVKLNDTRTHRLKNTSLFDPVKGAEPAEQNMLNSRTDPLRVGACPRRRGAFGRGARV